MQTNDYFGYYDGTGIVPENAFRISPSQISKFFDTTSKWYREHLLGEEGFEGSNASELGNCVHAAASMYTLERTVHYEQIEEYIDSLSEDFDKDYIRQQYVPMTDVLIAYLQSDPIHETEVFLWHEIIPSVGVGGSIDGIKYRSFRGNSPDYKGRGNVIRDFKTTSGSVPSKFPRAYWFQQLTYAYLCKKNGIDIDYLELLYITTSNVNRISEKTGKRLKDYPSLVQSVVYEITDDDWNIIEDILSLVAHSVDMWNNHPQFRWALAQDWRFKSLYKPTPKLFKK
jgi:hypothetical protein